MDNKLPLKLLLMLTLTVSAHSALSDLTREQITDKSKPVWRDFTANLVHQFTIDIPFGTLNKLLCIFNKVEYRKWANLQRDAEIPAYAYLANIDERQCERNMEDYRAVVRATQSTPDDPVTVEYWNAPDMGQTVSNNITVTLTEEATVANPFGIMTLDQAFYSHTNDKMLLRWRSESSRVDEATVQYQAAFYLDEYVINQSLPLEQQEEFYGVNLYFEEGDAGYGTIINKYFFPIVSGSGLYPAGIPYSAGATNIAFNTDYIRYERYQDVYQGGTFVQNKALVESACVSRANSWPYVPSGFGYGVYASNGDRNLKNFSATYTNAEGENIAFSVYGFSSLGIPNVCRSLKDGSVVTGALASNCTDAAGLGLFPAYDIPDLTTITRSGGLKYIVRQLKPRKTYSQVDMNLCADLVLRETLPAPSHLFFEGHSPATAVPTAGAMLVNDFSDAPDVDPYYAGKKYMPIIDDDEDGVPNYADMFPEDQLRSADRDYDGLADDIDANDDRLLINYENFDYPGAVEYVTPSMYQPD
jgi:hypothetical protein